MLCKTHHYNWQGPGPSPGQGEEKGESGECEGGEEIKTGEKVGRRCGRGGGEEEVERREW